jgi:hypothetical protein
LGENVGSPTAVECPLFAFLGPLVPSKRLGRGKDMGELEKCVFDTLPGFPIRGFLDEVAPTQGTELPQGSRFTGPRQRFASTRSHRLPGGAKPSWCPTVWRFGFYPKASIGFLYTRTEVRSSRNPVFYKRINAIPGTDKKSVL